MEDSLFMIQRQIMQYVDDIKHHDDIKPEEIPEYRLYISQLEEFFDKKLGKAAGDEEEKKAISKTMIQNYIKEGLLMPPNGKCYNRGHVILLALIYNLKSILTIKDIKKLLSPIFSTESQEENREENEEDDESIKRIEYLYNTYLELKQKDSYKELLTNKLDAIYDYLNDKPEITEPWYTAHLLLLVLILIEQANVRKKIAEYIINQHFSLIFDQDKEP
ncbi:MAG: DUF1836 domain-containing protein [Clostridiales bacterium]|jgi:hypothetical protein|nr:DUF1836 domain-containing protein [Clostridiales bacterium]